MPGVASLQKQQYYGHPRNAFWPIMGLLFGADPKLNYLQRTNILKAHKVAVWDVLQSCYRPGSLDANIRHDSININDFIDFFAAHPNIQKVFFNGKAAKNLFNKHVEPILASTRFDKLDYLCLPSTSPAFATLSFEQKLANWEIITSQT